MFTLQVYEKVGELEQNQGLQVDEEMHAAEVNTAALPKVYLQIAFLATLAIDHSDCICRNILG